MATRIAVLRTVFGACNLLTLRWLAHLILLIGSASQR